MKIKKILLFIAANILLLILLLFISDLCIYGYNALIYKKTHNSVYIRPPFKYVIHPNYGADFGTYFTGTDNVYRGRKPDGTQYQGKPIVVFGCSYAQGQFLDNHQTFSRKLSDILKRPVYNRAIPGRGIQHMYMQALSEEFYRDVPPAEDYIYILLGDHYRRMGIYFIDITDNHNNGHFSRKGDKLVLDDENNIFMNILKSSYTVRMLNYQYVKRNINNPKNAEKLTDLVLLYFTETRKEIEKRLGKKINFTVITYDNFQIPYKDMLCEKLKKNGFNVIETKDLTDEDLNAPKYLMVENAHPSEEAWNLLTPKIAEYFK